MAVESKLENWTIARWRESLTRSRDTFKNLFEQPTDKRESDRFFLCCIKLLRLFVWHKGVFWNIYSHQKFYTLESFRDLLSGRYTRWCYQGMNSLFHMWGCTLIINSFCLHVRSVGTCDLEPELKKYCTVPILPELSETLIDYIIDKIKTGYAYRSSKWSRMQQLSHFPDPAPAAPPPFVSSYFSSELENLGDIADADERRRIMTEWTTAFAKS